MSRKDGYYIVLGLVIGAIFGVLFGSPANNTLFGLGLGALGGVFLGWFVAAIALQNRKEKKQDK